MHRGWDEYLAGKPSLRSPLPAAQGECLKSQVPVVERAGDASMGYQCQSPDYGMMAAVTNWLDLIYITQWQVGSVTKEQGRP